MYINYFLILTKNSVHLMLLNYYTCVSVRVNILIKFDLRKQTKQNIKHVGKIPCNTKKFSKIMQKMQLKIIATVIDLALFSIFFKIFISLVYCTCANSRETRVICPKR